MLHEITTLNDVFRACVEPEPGKSHPETLIEITYGVLKDKEEANFDKEFSLSYTSLELSKFDNFLELDIDFEDSSDIRINSVLDMLHNYKKDRDELPPDLYPSLHFTLIPMKLKARYSLIMANPVFFALSSDRRNQMPHKIKMIFWSDECIVTQNDDIDYDKMLQKMRKKLDDEIFYYEKQKEKEEKDELELKRKNS